MTLLFWPHLLPLHQLSLPVASGGAAAAVVVGAAAAAAALGAAVAATAAQLPRCPGDVKTDGLVFCTGGHATSSHTPPQAASSAAFGP